MVGNYEDVFLLKNMSLFGCILDPIYTWGPDNLVSTKKYDATKNIRRGPNLGMETGKIEVMFSHTVYL